MSDHRFEHGHSNHGFERSRFMVAAIHVGLDKIALALADRAKHQPVCWVEPPNVDPAEPLGALLPEPRTFNILWPRQACEIEVAAPTDFLPPPNDRLKIRFWPGQGTHRGAVILIPPWKLGSFAGFMPVVRGLQNMGYDVVGYPTPYHFERTAEGTFSGELFITFDMPRSGWAVRTACLELCALVESLQTRGPVVLLGTSIGGYLSAMSQVVALRYPHRRFQAERMVLIVPPGSVLDTFLHTAIGERYCNLLKQSGCAVPDRSFLAQLAVPFTPSNFPSAVTGERAMVLAARHDHMVPLRSSKALAASLGARFKEYEAGHVSALCLTLELWLDVKAFLAEIPVAEDPVPTTVRSEGSQR